MTERVARLLLHALWIGIRDPDEDFVGVRRCSAQVLQLCVFEGLDSSVDHPQVHPTMSPASSSTRPPRRIKSRRAPNPASSGGPRSCGTETSRAPAGCGS